MKTANFKFLLLLISLLFVFSCDNSEPTKPKSNSLIGTWVLSSMKVNNNTVNPDDYNDVAVKITFNSDGTGKVWIEDYGYLEEESPISFIWHTNDNQLSIQLSGEDEGVATYSVSGNTLTLTFSDEGESWVFTYSKQ